MNGTPILDVKPVPAGNVDERFVVLAVLVAVVKLAAKEGDGDRIY